MEKNKAKLGFHIEISTRIANIKKIKALTLNDGIQILNISNTGKVGVEKKNAMIVLKNKLNEPNITPGIMRFSLMNCLYSNQDIERTVKIINVLGNDRLIREKISLFMTGKSSLNSIPELQSFQIAINTIEKSMPGFIESAWYYAPEVVWAQ